MPPMPIRSNNAWPATSEVFGASVSAASDGPVRASEEGKGFVSDTATPPQPLREGYRQIDPSGAGRQEADDDGEPGDRYPNHGSGGSVPWRRRQAQANRWRWHTPVWPEQGCATNASYQRISQSGRVFRAAPVGA